MICKFLAKSPKYLCPLKKSQFVLTAVNRCSRVVPWCENVLKSGLVCAYLFHLNLTNFDCLPHMFQGFQGAAKLTIDPKGRISMPSRHRDQLVSVCAGQLTVTRHPDGCLLVYPRSRWETKRAELAAMPYSARALQRLLLGNATDVDLDSAGRLLVPSSLRDDAQLTREVSLIGMGAHFELWDPTRLREREERDLADGLPMAAGDFSF